MNSSRLRAALIVSFILLVTAITWMASLRHYLVIPGKTNALYSLEITWSRERVQEVIALWESRIDKAHALNKADFFLIFSFASFYCCSIIWLSNALTSKPGRFRSLLLMATLVAASLDIIEGVAIHQWLNGNFDSISPFFITITAIIKFAIVIPVGLLIVGGFARLLFRKQALS